MTAPETTLAGRLRAALLAAAYAAPVLLGAIPAASPAAAQGSGSGYMRLTAEETAAGQTISLGVNKSMVVDLPRAAGDVLVSNPEIADAVLRTSTRLYLIGVKLGQANVFLFDSSGAQIGSLDISVEADLGALNQLLAEAVQGGYVRASALNGSIVLRGEVRSASDSQRAEELTRGMLARSPQPLLETASAANGAASAGAGAAPAGAAGASATGLGNTPGIINLLTITGEEQVALKVTIAEVQRSVTKQLGLNVSATYTGDNFGIGNFADANAPDAATGFSPITRDPLAGAVAVSVSSGGFDINAALQALDETNMIRTLAEPTLTAVSGEMATFLAGGEFGYRTIGNSDSGGAIYTTEFKPFGVQLSFTPIVLSPGRISLRVGTSVSEITGVNNEIPSLSVRKAETTVEQPSGGSFVIGGLLQQNTQRAVSGFPGLQRIPILGALFASKTFQASESELIIIVTPYIVKPTSPKALARPGDNLAVSGDADTYFRNRLTKVYGAAAKGAERTGFNFD